jgi:acetoacetyl-CoA reductase
MAGCDEEAGLQFHAYPCDVANYENAQACLKKVADEIGPIDVLVNNAGITRDTTFKKMDKAGWDRSSRPISTRCST